MFHVKQFYVFNGVRVGVTNINKLLYEYLGCDRKMHNSFVNNAYGKIYNKDIKKEDIVVFVGQDCVDNIINLHDNINAKFLYIMDNKAAKVIGFRINIKCKKCNFEMNSGLFLNTFEYWPQYYGLSCEEIVMQEALE